MEALYTPGPTPAFGGNALRAHSFALIATDRSTPESLSTVKCGLIPDHSAVCSGDILYVAELRPWITLEDKLCSITTAAFVSASHPRHWEEPLIGRQTTWSGRSPSSDNVTWSGGGRFAILTGDATDIVPTLPAVDCVVSSPPYFAQRTYGDNSKELGREENIDAYISRLADLFAAIPLQPWASVWVNIGDKRRKDGALWHIPERFIFAMEARGFVLVDKVVWAKEVTPVQGPPLGHGMIEPAPGRLNGNGYEPFYRFVRNPKSAWTDTCPVRVSRRNVEDIRYLPESLMECDSSVEGRNLNNVWLVPMGQTKRNHYAVFPPALVERPIAMTCPSAVTELGPRDRIIEMVPYDDGQPKRRVGKYSKSDSAEMSGRQDTGRAYIPRKPVTRGWTLIDLPSRPGIVLDPFAGTGTTGEVAIKLGRRFIGIELYPGYAAMAVKRCKAAARVYELNLKVLATDPSFTTTSGIVHVSSAVTDKASGAMLVAQTFETTFGRPPSLLAFAYLN